MIRIRALQPTLASCGEIGLVGETEFSVVVLTFNRPNQLSACLDALAGQVCQRSAFEITVVDDGGTCGTTATAHS
jgi:glycosyltransferase involved in cell wall biosynthesis